MSNPAVPSVNVSQPSLTAMNKSSRRSQKIANTCLVLLVIVGLLGLAASTYLFINKMNQNKIDTEKEQLEAHAVQRLAVTRAIVEDVLNPSDSEDENNMVILSLYSKPSGASVYFDGFYVGETPINEKKMLKSNDSIDVVMFKEDHEVARRKIPLTEETYSDTLTLVKIVEQAPAVQKTVVQEGVVANKAVVIMDTQKAKPKAKKTGSSKKKDAAAPESVDMGIVLPD